MLDLRCGDQLMHNGAAVELLYRVPKLEGEVWRVRPLFVRGEDRNERFGPHDAVSELHTRGRAKAA
jgi:hypothetical protein